MTPNGLRLERRLEAILDPEEAKPSTAKVVATGIVLVAVSAALLGSLTVAGVLPEARFLLGSLAPRPAVDPRLFFGDGTFAYGQVSAVRVAPQISGFTRIR